MGVSVAELHTFFYSRGVGLGYLGNPQHTYVGAGRGGSITSSQQSCDDAAYPLCEDTSAATTNYIHYHDAM